MKAKIKSKGVPKAARRVSIDAVKALAALDPEQARPHLRMLMLANPNYFGTIKKSPFKPVLNIQSDTAYEEIGCVGFHTQLSRLEAVVYVKQQSGYSGGICTNGSQDHLRFYLSFDNGVT